MYRIHVGVSRTSNDVLTSMLEGYGTGFQFSGFEDGKERGISLRDSVDRVFRKMISNRA